MKNITVYCGSSEGYDETYREMAYALGAAFADKHIGLVYGGGKIGLMGAVAEGCLQNGGRVQGVIPTFLRTKEVAHEGVTEMVVVETMHERKIKMYEACDGIITLPGGWGTMEEFFEMLTWAQLGLHTKPIGILNINGYYDSLKALIGHMVQEGFLKEEVADILLVSDSIDELLDMMAQYQPPDLTQYLHKRTT